MSRIALNGNLSGTGTFTLASPNSSTDRTLNLPDAGGTVFVSGQAVTATTGNFSGNVTLGSSVLATPTGSAPAYLCRAWVNFDGTGTPAIRASGNVSSITDSGTGNYTVNFTTAMPDTSYSVTASSVQGSNAATNYITQICIQGLTTSGVNVLARPAASSDTKIDLSDIYMAIFR